MITLLTNITLDNTATGLQTGTVGEPSVAASSGTVFATGNWYASRSADAGVTWTAIDPFTELPSVADGFCCDQLVIYSKAHRRWIWLLQYSADATGANAVRIATSRTAASGTWTWWDLRPTDVDASWTNLWFDFPDLAESAQHLWVSCNVFDGNDRWKRSVALRIPWADILAGGSLTRQMWTSTELAAPRFVSGAGDHMWFATLGSGPSELEVFSWADDAAAVSSWTVPVSPWNATNYQSNGPGGAPWLSRADDRITGAWRSRGRLGFLWTAASRPGRPHPYIRCVRIDEATVTVVDEPDLFSANGAWAYPAAAPNTRGDVGITAFFGGPTHPAHAVGRFDDIAGTWETAITATSTHGPDRGKWGDYIVCHAHPRRRTAWIASGYTLNGGTDRAFVDPRYVVFR